MKKIRRIGCILLLVFSVTLVMTACGTTDTGSQQNSGSSDQQQQTDTRNLQIFMDAYRDAGHTLTNVDIPSFHLIGATVGIMFYINNHVVKIYGFQNEIVLDATIKDNPFLSPIAYTMARNGRFLAESSNNSLLTIFNAVPI